MSVKLLPTPPLPVLARIKGATVAEATASLIQHFNKRPAPFNYRRSVKAVRGAYKGLHSLPQLQASCTAESTEIGRKSNFDVVTLAAPLAFGRTTRVVDLSPRRFPFGRDRFAAYRVPFFFIENRTVKAYFVQPSKYDRMTLDELAMVATILKTYLLDTEFYGEQCDVEFVVLQAPEELKERVVETHSLASLPLWTPKRLEDRLTLLSEALAAAASSDEIAPRARREPPAEKDMPLF